MGVGRRAGAGVTSRWGLVTTLLAASIVACDSAGRTGPTAVRTEDGGGIAALSDTGPLNRGSPAQPSLEQSLITVSEAVIPVGGTSVVTLQVKDQDGNDLSTSGLSVEFYYSSTRSSSEGTFSPTVDNGDGTYQSTFTGTAAGAAVAIGATMGGIAVTSPPPTIQVSSSDTPPPPPPPSGSTLTRVGTVFYLNGVPISTFGIRAANALQSDAIMQRLIDAFPSMKAHGIQSFSVTIQGGRYTEGGNSAFNGYQSNGQLKSEYRTRLTTILNAAEAAGMVPMVKFFYRGRDQELVDANAVRAAVTNTMEYLKPWRNVWVNVMNEPDHPGYTHPILKTAAGQVELFQLAKSVDSQRIVYVSHVNGANDGFLSDSWGRNGVGATSPAGTVSVEYLQGDTFDVPGVYSAHGQSRAMSDMKTADDRGIYFYWHSAWHQKADAPGWPRFDKGGAGTSASPGVTFAWNRMQELSGL